MTRRGLSYAVRDAAGRAPGSSGPGGYAAGAGDEMRRAGRYQDGLTGGRDAGLDGSSADPHAAGQHQPPAPPPGDDGGERPGLGGLWLLLAPVACCGGPFLIAALAAAGALAWAGLGLAAAVLVAVVVVVLVRRRRRRLSRGCCVPGTAGWPGGAGASARRPTGR